MPMWSAPRNRPGRSCLCELYRQALTSVRQCLHVRRTPMSCDRCTALLKYTLRGGFVSHVEPLLPSVLRTVPVREAGGSCGEVWARTGVLPIRLHANIELTNIYFIIQLIKLVWGIGRSIRCPAAGIGDTKPLYEGAAQSRDGLAHEINKFPRLAKLCRYDL
jgi:hypothetical protein